MKRSAFKPSSTPMKRSSKPMASVGARAKRMRMGKVKPTSEEALWMSACQDHGCIVCRLNRGCYADAEIHHLKQGGRRMGHLFSVPLCAAHHRLGSKEGMFISIHPYKARWVAAYGTELELLDVMREILGTMK